MKVLSETPAFHRVAIVGAGIVSPLGFGQAETVSALQDAQDRVGPVRTFSTEKTRCQTAAHVDDSRLFEGRRTRRQMRLHRASYMVITALDEALAQAGAFAPEVAIVGTTSGGMTFGEQFYRALLTSGNGRRNARLVSNYPPQKQIVDALQRFGLETSVQVIANACASGSNAIGQAFAGIRAGRYRRVLTGGYDAISELVFVGFDSLQASTPEKCRPFDRGRSGMVLGEGAALLALEELESARARGASILGEVVGYGISTDNHHLTQPNPDGSGARRAMAAALTSARLQPDQIGYINAHGTATIFNDAAEGKAIGDLFGARTPVSSTKGMMGHSLGAAGAVEAVFSLLALQQQFLPPNINFREADVPLAVVANEARAAQFDYALSNSFGFGGTNASVILARAAAS